MPNKKMGRPTDNPKKERITVRLDEECSQILDKYCEQEQQDRAEAIRMGVKKLKDDIKNRALPPAKPTTFYTSEAFLPLKLLYHRQMFLSINI